MTICPISSINKLNRARLNIRVVCSCGKNRSNTKKIPLIKQWVTKSPGQILSRPTDDCRYTSIGSSTFLPLPGTSKHFPVFYVVIWSFTVSITGSR